MRRLYRVVFSSAAVSAALIIGEVLAVGLLLIAAAYRWVPVYAFLSVLNMLVAAGVITEDCNPEFKLSWLVIILALPFFGAVLYLIFHKRRLSRKEKERGKRIKAQILADGGDLDHRSLLNLTELAKKSSRAASDALSILKDDGLAAVFSNTSIRYFPDGEGMYASMLSDLKDARKYVFLEYFIIEEGQMWQGVLNILKEKAPLGVDVRLIYDGVGSLGRLPRDFDKSLSEIGIKVIRFGALTPLATAAHNSRDHRKLLIIDGEIAYTGGVNVADEYINLKSPHGHWKDGGVRVLGDAALGFARMFSHTYSLASGESFADEPRAAKGSPSPDLGAACAVTPDGGYYIPFCDGPAPLFPSYTSKSAIINLICGSEDFLFITTPYLIIDYDLAEALRRAAKRGVDVRIITPGVPDKRVVKIMTKSSYHYLLAGGVRIFEYERGFIHEKLMLSGSLCGIVGTINLDYRSLVHHLEDGLFIYGSPELEKMKEEFLRTQSRSREIRKSSARLTLPEAIIRSLVRLLAPLL